MAFKRHSQGISMQVSPTHTAILLSSIAALASSYSLAEPDPFNPGFSGTISINIGFGQSQSQNNTHEDNEITADLTNQGKKLSQASPFFLGRLQYSFGDTLLFLGNSEEQIAEAQFQAELGVAHRFNNAMILTAALFGNVPSMEEVWRDPYLTGQKRQTTEQTVGGVRFAMDITSPLPISLKYAVASSEVEYDDIGLSQGLTTEARSQLKRASDYQRFGAEISFPLSQSFVLSPAFYYTLRDADGDAKSNQLLTAQMSFLIAQGRHSVITTLRNSSASFDADNPVFSRKQDYESFGFFSVYSYADLWGWRNTQLNVMAGYQESDSDIDFYDSEEAFLSTGISYSF
ncbi:DUF2860 family protein [Vibrio vulnificus]|uniref:DUF2860 family protein n=1 Tax=Vibrio vulnificus TaxID=672 RepID=UPI0040594FB2